MKESNGGNRVEAGRGPQRAESDETSKDRVWNNKAHTQKKTTRPGTAEIECVRLLSIDYAGKSSRRHRHAKPDGGRPDETHATGCRFGKIFAIRFCFIKDMTPVSVAGNLC